MLAYHNDANLKARFVALIAAHEEADQIVQGTYFSDDGGHLRMCAVGCSIESLRQISGRTDLAHNNHAVYEEMIGVPRVLARLQDGIHEGLPTDEMKRWPRRFASAIREGADLSLVWPRFAVWLLSDPQDGVIKFAKTDGQRAAIQHVAELYERQIGGEAIALSEWQAAAHAAAAYAAHAAHAAAAAAYADAAAYAAYAAYAAADADAHAAAAAAYADAAAYAAYAAADAYLSARQQARIRQADYLIALLEAA